MLIVALAALTAVLAGALWYALGGRPGAFGGVTGDIAPVSCMGLYTAWGLAFGHVWARCQHDELPAAGSRAATGTVVEKGPAEAGRHTLSADSSSGTLHEAEPSSAAQGTAADKVGIH